MSLTAELDALVQIYLQRLAELLDMPEASVEDVLRAAVDRMEDGR